jgi:small subunit ribosomal protein S21
LTIKVYHNDVEKALKILKRQLQKEGFSKAIRSKRFYEKPSARKKRKHNEAQRRRKKALSFR